MRGARVIIVARRFFLLMKRVFLLPSVSHRFARHVSHIRKCRAITSGIKGDDVRAVCLTWQNVGLSLEIPLRVYTRSRSRLNYLTSEAV